VVVVASGSLSAGVVVGAVLGALFSLCLLCCLLFYVRRRRSAAAEAKSESSASYSNVISSQTERANHNTELELSQIQGFGATGGGGRGEGIRGEQREGELESGFEDLEEPGAPVRYEGEEYTG